MNLEELANEKNNSLTANDREMLTAIFRDKQAVGKMNSTQLASFLHVSRTTFVRLMKKLDISSYAEFKLLLNRKEAQTAALCDLEEVVREYHVIIDEMKKHDYRAVCEKLYRADTIYLYGTGNEQKSIAEEFKRIFLALGKCCVDLFDMGEVKIAGKRFMEDDLFVVISLSGENPDAVQVVRAAQEMGISTIAFTRWANNTLARLCQENLYVGTKTVSQITEQPYEMIAAFYILLDILSVRYLEFTQTMRETGHDS